MMTIAITQAKIGRSMKKLTTPVPIPRSPEPARGRPSRARAVAAAPSGSSRPRHLAFGHDLGAGFRELQPLDDDPLAGLRDPPSPATVADRAVGLDHAQLDLVVALHDQRGRLALLVVGDATLRDQQSILRRLLESARARTCPAATAGRDWGISARRVTEPVAWSTVTSENCSLPVVRIVAAVLETRCTCAWLPPALCFNLPGRELALQAQQHALGCVTST